MERRTALQAAGVFVVTVLAGLPFALQVGHWLGGGRVGTPPAPPPASTGADPTTEPDAEAAEPGAEVAQPPDGSDPRRPPAGRPLPTTTAGPGPAKAAPLPDAPVEGAPVEPTVPPDPTGGPEPPPEPPAEPTPPEPTLPVGTGAPQADIPAIVG
jgi:hypothetical protein